MPFLPNKRNHLDVFVAVLTYVFTAKCLMASEVTPELVFPLFLCGVYEFFFDYGQHLHTYGTQNLHFFACMCAPHLQPSCTGVDWVLLFFLAHVSTSSSLRSLLRGTRCFDVGKGQLVGIQLFLSWFYFASGFCKLGPTFQHMFTANLVAAKFMVSHYRRTCRGAAVTFCRP